MTRRRNGRSSGSTLHSDSSPTPCFPSSPSILFFCMMLTQDSGGSSSQKVHLVSGQNNPSNSQAGSILRNECFGIGIGFAIHVVELVFGFGASNSLSWEHTVNLGSFPSFLPLGPHSLTPRKGCGRRRPQTAAALTPATLSADRHFPFAAALFRN